MEIYNLHLTKRLCHNGSHAVIGAWDEKKIANRRDKIGEQHQQQQQRLRREIKYILRLAGDLTWQSSGGGSSISFVFLFNSWILNRGGRFHLVALSKRIHAVALSPANLLLINLAERHSNHTNEKFYRERAREERGQKGINRTVASQKGNESKYYRH